jgi:hypothetical protein
LVSVAHRSSGSRPPAGCPALGGLFEWAHGNCAGAAAGGQREPRDRGRDGRIFELIADPAQQPRWDGNNNLAQAPAGQRVRRAGEVFTMTLTHDGAIRENHVVEFEEGRRIAWRPAESGKRPPGHLW